MWKSISKTTPHFEARKGRCDYFFNPADNASASETMSSGE
jgi:hypothetical protein